MVSVKSWGSLLLGRLYFFGSQLKLHAPIPLFRPSQTPPNTKTPQESTKAVLKRGYGRDDLVPRPGTSHDAGGTLLAAGARGAGPN
jgi:hypothetical protein